ncbi:MAG: type II toxin-antitoxin system VapC family toxin [Acidobacteriota bacterium]|jgi:PIN domain nuclease of toxin-antitoxin system
MRLLLDTHIWLWSLVNPDRLSPKVSRELENPEDEIWLSPISVWELLPLARKGRVVLKGEPESWVREALSKVSLKEAWLTHEVVTQSLCQSENL